MKILDILFVVFELYNFVREYKTSDEIRRIWNPKKDESVIHDKDN